MEQAVLRALTAPYATECTKGPRCVWIASGAQCYPACPWFAVTTGKREFRSGGPPALPARTGGGGDSRPCGASPRPPARRSRALRRRSLGTGGALAPIRRSGKWEVSSLAHSFDRRAAPHLDVEPVRSVLSVQPAARHCTRRQLAPAHHTRTTRRLVPRQPVHRRQRRFGTRQGCHERSRNGGSVASCHRGSKPRCSLHGAHAYSTTGGPQERPANRTGRAVSDDPT